MTLDDLGALRDATQTLVDLVERLDAHHRGHGVLDDDEIEGLQRESGPACEAWQEAFRQGVITARTPRDDGVAVAPADPGDPPVDLTEPLNSA